MESTKGRTQHYSTPNTLQSINDSI